MKNSITAIAWILFLLSCTKQQTLINDVTGSSVDNSTTSTIQFSGYTWNVKNGNKLGPGPNYWRKNNVWVDGDGFLHLKITYDSTTKKWYCAEVSTKKTFGNGRLQFWVDGRIDQLDKNVVLGLFNYSGNDGYDEMDIEWARWGNASYPNCNFTVWPAEKGDNFSYTKEASLSGSFTTQRFTRTDTSVYFQSLQGFTGSNINTAIASANCISSSNSISTLPMPAYINLWLFKGIAPSNGKEVEIVIHKFSYKQ